MAKSAKLRSARNIILKGKGGDVVIASTKGRISTANGKLPAKLEALLAQRQNAGMALTAALKEAGFDVIAGTETDFWNFDTDAPGSRPKKKKKK